MDRYSRLVAWLKVLLPLTALALLSTLFLLSHNIDPVASIPFAQSEVEDRLRGQQLTEPYFSGTTDSGDSVSVAARTMMTESAFDNSVTELTARIDLTSGTRVMLFADAGEFNLTGGASNLRGNVVMTTTTGYTLNTDELTANFDTLMVESPGPVSGIGLFGRLDAGKMRLSKDDATENTHLIFTNGVKLVYDPRDSEE
jgi:lipopolysaccharide export system protein LptC